MIEISAERYVEARCEQVWMVVDDSNCRARWLVLNDQIQDIVISEPTRIVSWNTQDHPHVSIQTDSNLTVELIPEGAGTRVRICASREPAGRLRELAVRVTGQKACARDIRLSLDQLAQLLEGRGR